MSNDRCLSILLTRFLFISCLLTIPLSQAIAQDQYLHPLRSNITGYDDDIDTTFQIVIGYGIRTNGIFEPDTAEHTYRNAVLDDTNGFHLVSPAQDTFRSFDTLIVTCHPNYPGVTRLSLSIEYLATISTTISHTVLRYSSPTVRVDNPTLQIGAQGCFIVITLRNQMTDSITISSLTFASSDNITLDSPRTSPIIVKPSGTLTFRICAQAPKTVDTLSCELTLLISAANKVRDTIQTKVIVPVVPLYYNHCMSTSDAFIRLEPWESSRDTTLFLTNLLSTPITITGIRQVAGDSTKVHYVSKPLPFNIPAHGTDSLFLTLQEDYNVDELEFQLFGTDSNGLECPATLASMDADTYRFPGGDDLEFGIYDPNFRTVQFFCPEGLSGIMSSVTLHNDGGLGVRITNFKIVGPDSIDWEVIHSDFDPTKELRDGDSVRFYMEFPRHPLPRGVYSSSLLLELDNGSIDTIPLGGYVYSLSVAHSIQSSARVTLRPNPSEGPIEIDLDHITRYAISISDIEGRTLFTKADLRSNRLRFADLPSDLIAGNYIVRVEGVDDEGHSFVLSRKLVVLHD